MPSPRTTKLVAILAAVAMVAVIIGASLVQVFSGGDDSSADEASTAPTTAPAAGDCTEPPAIPKTAMSFDAPPEKAAAEGASWEATVSTNCGDIVFTLDGEKAPQTVASFNFLSQEGYYDDSPCHRLTVQGLFVLQCGDPTGTGGGNPGYGYGIENAPENGSYPRGTLAMARTEDPNSNGSQFFVVFQDTELPTEGGGYSIFGQVTEGMHIVDRIAEMGVAGGLPDGAPAQPISILGIDVAKVG